MKVNWAVMIEEMYNCPDCDFRLNVWRNKERRRCADHIKSLYCVKCNEQKQFVRGGDR